VNPAGVLAVAAPASETVAAPCSEGAFATVRLVPALSDARLRAGVICALVWKVLSVSRNSPSANWPTALIM
jgi:hypothetical protein